MIVKTKGRHTFWHIAIEIFLLCFLLVNTLMNNNSMNKLIGLKREFKPGFREEASRYLLLEDDGRCGNWQQAYRQYASKMLQLPPEMQRLAVFSAEHSGLCDRLTSAVTIFYVALLTKRAFKIEWKNLAPLESAFDQPNVNWTASPSDVDPSLGAVKTRQYYTNRIVPEWHSLNDYFSKENLTQLDAEVRTVVFELNQGQIWTLFENPNHKRDLEAMGLLPETAFGCAMHFLFSPRPETLSIMKETWQEIWPCISKKSAANSCHFCLKLITVNMLQNC
jgi:hypothetical protein